MPAVRDFGADDSPADLADLLAVNAKVVARDSNEVTVNASGWLDVDASGASHVYYLGSPTLGKVSTAGASAVEQKQAPGLRPR